MPQVESVEMSRSDKEDMIEFMISISNSIVKLETEVGHIQDNMQDHMRPQLDKVHQIVVEGALVQKIEVIHNSVEEMKETFRNEISSKNNIQLEETKAETIKWSTLGKIAAATGVMTTGLITLLNFLKDLLGG